MDDSKAENPQNSERSAARGNLPGPVFYAVALFQSLGFHVPYFFLPENFNPLSSSFGRGARRGKSIERSSANDRRQQRSTGL